MAIIVYVLDDEKKIKSKIGLIEDDDLLSLTDLATEKDLKCLAFVDFVGDTYFNEKQLREILQEIEVLKADEQANQEIVEIIQKGCLEALENFNYYLKFQGE